MRAQTWARRISWLVVGIALTAGAIGCANPAGSDASPQPGGTGGDGTAPGGDDGPPVFISTWDTGTSKTVTLPLVDGGTYDFIVDWGDGSTDDITTHNDSAVSHTYEDAGEYEIRITGTIEGWSFDDSFGSINAAAQSVKILEISSWGPLAFGDTEAQFMGASNLEITASDVPDLSETRDLDWAFYDASSLTTVPNMGDWDTSNVQSMRSIFHEASNFNTDIGGWDTSNVVNMQNAFRRATAFDQDLSSWDVSALVNANTMFTSMTLSTANYDALLIGWEEQLVKNNVTFHGGDSKYSAGAAATARQNLIDDHSWTITDGGQAP